MSHDIGIEISLKVNKGNIVEFRTADFGMTLKPVNYGLGIPSLDYVGVGIDLKQVLVFLNLT